MTRRRRYCRNRGCIEPLHGRRFLALCPSCQFIGGLGVFIGGLIAGAIAWVLH